jgi:ribosomal protein S18 acetylase RimI-like enzyme
MYQVVEGKRPVPGNDREIRIASGMSPEDTEVFLDMATACGLFSLDVMATAEDMAWESAYGDGREAHTFLRASTNECGQEKTVGFICYGPIPYWPERHELYGITVDPQYHRKGIGTALLAEMEKRVARAGGKQIFLETGSDYRFEGAQSFYEANGFEHERRYIKQFVPAEGGSVYRRDVETNDHEDAIHQ